MVVSKKKSQLAALAICRANLVARLGQGVQLVILPDLVCQPMKCTNYRVHFICCHTRFLNIASSTTAVPALGIMAIDAWQPQMYSGHGAHPDIEQSQHPYPAIEHSQITREPEQCP